MDLQWKRDMRQGVVTCLCEVGLGMMICIMHSAFNLCVFPNYMFTLLLLLFLLFFFYIFFMKGL